jgi:hypothetical protein
MQGSQKWLIHHIADVQQSNFVKDNNEILILITLDAEKAFDVVDHTHLFWKIYHQDITGST